MIKQEETVALRLEAIKEMLFIMSDATNKHGEETMNLRDYVD